MLVILSCLNKGSSCAIYRRRLLPLNHKGVLCRKTLTTGRLLTEISPYATWSSTLPCIVLVLTSSCIFFLASFRFSALFRSGPFWHSRIFTPIIWNGIPSNLRLQPAVSADNRTVFDVLHLTCCSVRQSETVLWVRLIARLCTSLDFFSTESELLGPWMTHLKKLYSSIGKFWSDMFSRDPVNFHFLHFLIAFLNTAAASNKVFISVSLWSVAAGCHKWS